MIKEFLKKGFSFTPLKGKRPVLKDWIEKASKDIKIIQEWQEKYKSFGVVLGDHSGVFVLDIDCKNGQKGLESLKKLEKQFGSLRQDNFHVKTPSGGYHLYYKLPDKLKIKIHANLSPNHPNIEVRGRGGQCVLIGPGYEFKGDLNKIPFPPEWLINFIKGIDNKKEVKVLEKKDNFAGRNDQLMHFGMRLKSKGFSYDEILCELTKLNEKFSKPLSSREISIIVKSCNKYQQHDFFTDLALAERLEKYIKNNYIFIKELKEWLYYSKGAWSQDNNKFLFKELVSMLKKMYIRACLVPKEKERKAATKLVLSLEENRKQQNIISILKQLLTRSVLNFDIDNYTFNLQNGTLNLKKDNLFKEHAKEDYLTKKSNVIYDKKATCKKFLTFLNQIFEDNQDLIKYVQKVLGRTLTGDIQEHDFYIFYGGGANGKTTLVNLIKYVLQDYAKNVDPEILMNTSKYDRGYYIAQLKGVRAVFASESAAFASLKSDVIKNLTGTNDISARPIYGIPFEFTPEFKLFLDTNHKPTIKDDSYGMWRRVKLIPFNVRIPEKDRDLQLYDKLIKEAPGVLNWLIEGLYTWKTQGMLTPDIVKLATNAYRNEEDIIKTFLTDCCIQKASALVKSSDLYARFQAWGLETGTMIKYISQKKLMPEIITKWGIEKTRKKDGVYWRHIGLLDTFTGGQF